MNSFIHSSYKKRTIFWVAFFCTH